MEEYLYDRVIEELIDLSIESKLCDSEVTLDVVAQRIVNRVLRPDRP